MTGAIINHRLIGQITAFAVVLLCGTILIRTPVYAGCVTCAGGDCWQTEATINAHHALGTNNLIGGLTSNYDGNLGKAVKAHQKWWTDQLFKRVLLPAMMKMSTQLSAMGLHQMMMIGTQFDAKEQLETQRDLQVLQAQAHKDYHPSEEFCAFGSNTRALAASHSKARFNAQALNQIAMERHMGTKYSADSKAAQGKRARWAKFISTYCNERDNGWNHKNRDDPSGTGLSKVCKLPDKETSTLNRMNIDINFMRQIEGRRTIDADFTDQDLPDSGEEDDLLTLMHYLYGNTALTRNITDLDSSNTKTRDDERRAYYDLRSFAAKRNVAQNSFLAIAGMKMKGSENLDEARQTGATIAAALRQLGMPEDEIIKYVGEQPSYYAQLELLSKKIFQDPGFFAGLYDKPVNVERRKVAIRAVELMVERAIYESRLRQEMLSSVLLAARLRVEKNRVQSNIAIAVPREE